MGREVERLGAVSGGGFGVGEDQVDGLGDRAAGLDDGVVDAGLDLLVGSLGDRGLERREELTPQANAADGWAMTATTLSLSRSSVMMPQARSLTMYSSPWCPQ